MDRVVVLILATLAAVGFLGSTETFAEKRMRLTEPQVMRSLDHYFSSGHSFIDEGEPKTIKTSKEGRAIISLIGEPRKLRSAALVIMANEAEINGKKITPEAIKENDEITERFMNNIAPNCADCLDMVQTAMQTGREKTLAYEDLKINVSGGAIGTVISVEDLQ